MATQSAHKKTERIEARASHADKSLLQKAAELRGRNLNEFVISAAVQEARRIVQHDEVIVLSTRDRKFFVEALLNPPVPNPRLQEAAERYKRSMNS